MNPDIDKKMFIDYLNANPIEKMRVLNQLINISNDVVTETNIEEDDYQDEISKEIMILARNVFQCPAEVVFKGSNNIEREIVQKVLVKIRDENVETLLCIEKIARNSMKINKFSDNEIINTGKMLKNQLDRIYIKNKNVQKTLTSQIKNLCETKQFKEIRDKQEKKEICSFLLDNIEHYENHVTKDNDDFDFNDFA